MTDRPQLVASLGARDPAGAAADARAMHSDVALVEVRLDRFAEPAGVDLARLVSELGRPAIFTLRPRAEGGEFAGSVAERVALHRAADAAGFAWLDLEEDVAAAVRPARARRIVSWHGVDEGACTAAFATAAVTRLRAFDADVVKIAAPAPDADAALAFVEAASAAGVETRVPVVAIAMGACGRWLRPLAGRFAMPFVYAAAHGSKKTAAGQLTVAEFLDVYRARHVTSATRVFAVVGADVSESLSPRAHNAVFRALNEDAVYVDLSTKSFAHAFAAATRLRMAGLSVTTPFKIDALAAAASSTPDAAAIGAANTLLARDGGWHALNTDAPGFQAAVDLAITQPEAALALTVGKSFDALELLDADLARARGQPSSALVFGAGGVARAIAWQLLRSGSKVYVSGRTFEKVAATVIAVGGGLEGVSRERAFATAWPMVVQAVGDGAATIPFDHSQVRRKGLAADVIVKPLDSAFLREARRWGRTPVPGLLMFVEQAVLQARAWTGREARELRPIIATAVRSAFA